MAASSISRVEGACFPKPHFTFTYTYEEHFQQFVNLELAGTKENTFKLTNHFVIAGKPANVSQLAAELNCCRNLTEISIQIKLEPKEIAALIPSTVQKINLIRINYSNLQLQELMVLLKKTNVHALSFLECYLLLADTNFFASLAQCTFTQLSIQRSQLQFEQFIQKISEMSNLKSLDISNCSLPQSCLQKLSQWLVHAHCPLQELTLAGNSIAEKKSLCMQGILDNAGRLTKLNLIGHHGDGPYIERLINILEKPENKLRQLMLVNNQIDANQLADLSNAFSHSNCKLQTLILDKNFINLKIIKNLTIWMNQSDCTLKKLSLNNCFLDNECMRELAEGFTSNRSIEELSLNDNSISALGLAAFFKELISSDAILSKLSLDDCMFGDAGLKQISNYLQQKNNIRILSIKETAISDTGLTYLSNALKHANCQLKELYIFNHIKYGEDLPTLLNELSARAISYPHVLRDFNSKMTIEFIQTLNSRRIQTILSVLGKEVIAKLGITQDTATSILDATQVIKFLDNISEQQKQAILDSLQFDMLLVEGILNDKIMIDDNDKKKVITRNESLSFEALLAQQKLVIKLITKKYWALLSKEEWNKLLQPGNVELLLSENDISSLLSVASQYKIPLKKMFTDFGANEILDALTDPNCKLQTLSIAGYLVRDSFYITLSAMLQNTKSPLKILDLPIIFQQTEQGLNINNGPAPDTLDLLTGAIQQSQLIDFNASFINITPQMLEVLMKNYRVQSARALTLDKILLQQVTTPNQLTPVFLAAEPEGETFKSGGEEKGDKKKVQTTNEIDKQKTPQKPKNFPAYS